MNYITDVFLDRAITKKFHNIFSTSLNCLYNLIYILRRDRRHSRPQTIRSFSFFFSFVVPLPLSYRQGKFHISSVICSSEAATGGVLKDVLKNFANSTFYWSVVFVIKSLTSVFLLKKIPIQVFFYEIYEILKNIYLEEHLFFQIRFSGFNCISRFKFETGKNETFRNSMYIKIFTFLQSHFFFSMLSSSKITELCSFIFNKLKSKVTCFSGLSLISIILSEYFENNIETFSCYSYENKRIISRKIARSFLTFFKAFPPIRFYLFSWEYAWE